MSAVVRTPECYPDVDPCLHGVLGPPAEPREARHADCSGGFHMPGVLGGWHCPCPCHRAIDREEGK